MSNPPRLYCPHFTPFQAKSLEKNAFPFPNLSRTTFEFSFRFVLFNHGYYRQLVTRGIWILLPWLVAFQCRGYRWVAMMDGSPDEVKERSKQFPYRLLDGVVVNNNKRRPKCPVPPFFARPPKTLKNLRATRQTNYLQACFVLFCLVFFLPLLQGVAVFMPPNVLRRVLSKGKRYTHTHTRAWHAPFTGHRGQGRIDTLGTQHRTATVETSQ